MAENPTSTEISLARAARSGSREAYATLVQAHYSAIHAFLFTLLRNRADAEDLTQETFLRALSKIHHFNPERPFRPWALTIARRLAISHWRREKPTTPLDETTPHPSAAMPNSEHDATLLWETARRGLKPNEFTALWGFYREGLSIRELSGVLRKTQPHTKVILHRARTGLRNLLDPETWQPASLNRKPSIPATQ